MSETNGTAPPAKWALLKSQTVLVNIAEQRIREATEGRNQTLQLIFGELAEAQGVQIEGKEATLQVEDGRYYFLVSDATNSRSDLVSERGRPLPAVSTPEPPGPV